MRTRQKLSESLVLDFEVKLSDIEKPQTFHFLIGIVIVADTFRQILVRIQYQEF